MISFCIALVYSLLVDTCFLVTFQVGAGLETFGAVTAEVRSLSGMRIQMLTQMRRFFKPFPALGARISPISTMNPENMRLDVRVPGEEFQAHPAGVLILREGRGFKLRVLMVLLKPVGLEHHLSLHYSVTGLAIVGGIDVVIIRSTG